MKAFVLFDDYLAYHEGKRVEASETHTIVIDGEERSIDLASDTWASFLTAVRPFWEAAAGGRQDVHERSADRDDLPPVHSFERRELLANVRKWAVSVGRGDEIRPNSYPKRGMIIDYWKANGGRPGG